MYAALFSGDRDSQVMIDEFAALASLLFSQIDLIKNLSRICVPVSSECKEAGRLDSGEGADVLRV